MNDIIKAIYARRAVRKYKKDVINKELIEQIVDAGRMAPSAMNEQPWKFYVVTQKPLLELISKETRKALARNPVMFSWKNIVKTVSSITNLAHGLNFVMEPDPIFHEAPVVIFITTSKDYEWAGLDIGMCSQNMMLAAHSLGINSCPIGLGKYVDRGQHYHALGIPSKEEIQFAILFGYANEIPMAKERKKDNAVFIE